MLDLVTGKDPPLEAWVQIGQGEGEPHLVVAAAGGDAGWDRDLVLRLDDVEGRGELVGEGGAYGLVQVVDPARWHGAAEPGGDRGERRGHANSEEVANAGVVGGRNTQLA